MSAAQKRRAVIDQYQRLIGRNLYSTEKRDYCFRPYDDGKYYSDCSSSICYSYKEAGIDIGILNTAALYTDGRFETVDADIQNGQITNPDMLRVGDILLFAGNDASRAYAGYVGHAEMVYSLGNDDVIICGHSGGTPKLRKLKTYCKTRYHAKADTPLGHQGLLKVIRIIKE